MTAEGGVPALRFSKFSGTWEEKPLESFVDKKRKITYGIVQPGDFVEDGVFLVRGGDYSDGWVEKSVIKKVTFEIDRPYKRSKLKAGDLLLTIVGANTGTVAVVPDWLEEANITQTTARVAIDSNAASSGFIEQILKSRAGKREVYRFIKGAAQPGLNLTDVEKFKITSPTLPEQQKIADFLGAVDTRVGLLRRRRDALRAYKKGMMQSLFSQKLRFTKPDGSPFPDWQEKRLGDVFDWIPTNSLSREMLTNEPSEIQNIHYGDIHTKFSARFKQCAEKVPYIKPGVSLRLDDASFCCAGDVVIADASEDYADIGKAIEIVEVAPKSLVAGLHTYIARPKLNTFSIGFSGYLFQTNALRKQIMRMAQGISVLGISKPNLSKLTINLPHPEEQQKIADTLTALDTKIDAVTAQMDAMLRFKKGLLQQMFV